ncbi:unnamed protein product [Closterium sp. Naga37s-1]|nr:unnamed protein product [Closterium sp. Naga37s-1]
MALDSTVALSGTSAARNSAARAAPRAVHTRVRSILEAPKKSTLHTGGMRSHRRVSRWNRSIRLTRRPPALLVSLLVVVAVLGNGSSHGNSSSLPRYTPCCSPSPHSTLAPHSPHSTLAPHSPHSTLAPLARLARIAPDAHHSINALQRVSRRLLQESSASPPGKSHPPRMLPAPSSPRMRAAPSSCMCLTPPPRAFALPLSPCMRAAPFFVFRLNAHSAPFLHSTPPPPNCSSQLPPLAPPSQLLFLPSRALPSPPRPSPRPCARQPIRWLENPFAVAPSSRFIHRHARRAESSFDEAFLADYIARSTHHYDPLLKAPLIFIACSTHHYDPLLKLGSGPFGDSFPCSGPEGEPWLVVRATIPDGLAGATWLPWTGAAAKRRAFNEEVSERE